MQFLYSALMSSQSTMSGVPPFLVCTKWTKKYRNLILENQNDFINEFFIKL